MWNEPSELDLEKLPKPYATENVPLGERVLGMHFFIGPCDWYAAEYNAQSRDFFGYVNLGNPMNAEWGLFSFDELRNFRSRAGWEIDRDLYWQPIRAKELECTLRNER